MDVSTKLANIKKELDDEFKGFSQFGKPQDKANTPDIIDLTGEDSDSDSLLSATPVQDMLVSQETLMTAVTSATVDVSGSDTSG